VPDIVPSSPLPVGLPAAGTRASRATHAARILAAADVLEVRARAQSRPEVRTVLAATREHFELLRLAPRVVIGRARDCDLVIDDPRVSRRHAALVVRRGELWIEDLGSTNGTTVDGECVSVRAIAPGEEVRFGGEAVRFWPR
jgi:pSer/pThr/pTyr-binding forkhead associated (FHA) protein